MKKRLFLLALFSVILPFSLISQSFQFDFAKQLAGDSQAEISCMVPDNLGNIYISGAFSGTVDFDPGTGISSFTSTGQFDAFFGKYTDQGVLVWVRKFGSLASESVQDMQLDGDGHLYLTGGYHYTVNFDPGVSSANMTATALNDVYIAKYDTSGAFEWVNGFGANGEDLGRSLTVDDSHNVYVTGSYSGDVWVGSSYLNGSGTIQTVDFFICRLDSSGNHIWAKGMGYNYNDAGQRILLNSNDELIISGYFTASVDFDPDISGFHVLTSANTTRDIFISRYDTTGDFISAKYLNGPGDDDFVYDMELLSDQSIILTGSCTGVTDFDPDQNGQLYTSNGGFVLSMNDTIAFNWVSTIDGPVTPASLFIDNADGIFLAGSYYNNHITVKSTGDFSVLPNSGYSDLFFTKFETNGNLSLINSIHSSSSVTAKQIQMDNSGDLYLGGSFVQGPVDFDLGSNVYEMTAAVIDPFFMRLNPCTAVTGVEAVSGCDSASVNGYTYYETGNYIQVLPASTGCDSIITIDASIGESTTNYFYQEACFEYLSPAGNLLTSNGTYYDTIPNFSGCDSIIIFDLVIHTVDTSVTYSNQEFFAGASNATFQWLDCNNSFAVIPGEVSSYFWAQQPGSYAVEVSQNGCVDTSACINTSNSIFENTTGTDMKVYPVPAHQELTVELGEDFKQLEYTVYDAIGRKIYGGLELNTDRIHLYMENTGLYIMEIKTETGIARLRLIFD